MTRSSSIVRGGQSTLHSIRMAFQVMREMVLSGVISGALVVAGMVYFTVPNYHWYIYYLYLRAWFGYNLSPASNPKFNYRSAEGDLFTARSSDVLNSPVVQKAVAEVDQTFANSLTAGILVAGTVATLLGCYFVFRGLRFNKRFNETGSPGVVTIKKLRSIVQRRNDAGSWWRFPGLRRHRSGHGRYSICGVSYPESAETRHTAFGGTSGTGKTIAMRALVKQIVANGDKAIIYDRMGSYTKEFYNPQTDIILNPLDQRSPCWAPFYEVLNPHQADQVAASLIELPRTGDPTWAEAARLALAETMKKMARLSLYPSNKMIIDMLVKSDFSRTRKFLEGTFAHNVMPEASPRTAASVVFTNVIGLRALRILKDGESYFSIRKWVTDDEKRGILFLPNRADQATLLKPLISCWLDITIESIKSLNQSSTRRVWVVIDELGSLQRLESILGAADEIRQFGGCMAVSFQSFAKMREIYGSDGADALISSFNTRVYFGTPEEGMAKWAARNLGEQKYSRYDEGLSYGASTARDGVNIHEREQKELVVMPSEIQSLKKLTGYIKFPDDIPPAKFQLKWSPTPENQPAFIARPGPIEMDIEDNDEPSPPPQPKKPKGGGKATPAPLAPGDGPDRLDDPTDHPQPPEQRQQPSPNKKPKDKAQAQQQHQRAKERSQAANDAVAADLDIDRATDPWEV